MAASVAGYVRVTDFPEAHRVLRYLLNFPSENVDLRKGKFTHSMYFLSTFWAVASAGVGAGGEGRLITHGDRSTHGSGAVLKSLDCDDLRPVAK